MNHSSLDIVFCLSGRLSDAELTTIKEWLETFDPTLPWDGRYDDQGECILSFPTANRTTFDKIAAFVKASKIPMDPGFHFIHNGRVTAFVLQ
jgi:hypothetical protein